MPNPPPARLTPADRADANSVRVATFNVALSRAEPGQLRRELTGTHAAQARALGAIVQTIRPDVLLLNELDIDRDGSTLELFYERFLARACHGQSPIHYPYRHQFDTNTGTFGGIDWDGDGVRRVPFDTQGYGHFAGQYAMALLSRLPFESVRWREFRRFAWLDQPESHAQTLPIAHALLRTQRLASKTIADCPISFPNGQCVHLLVSHPSPPIGHPNPAWPLLNAYRNHDELRWLADYLDPPRAQYIHDDHGGVGGLAPDAPCIVLGDLNADPLYGDHHGRAIDRLLDHPRIGYPVARGSAIPRSDGAAALGRPTATASFIGALRVDYVLPSREFRIIDSGVFWPRPGQPHGDWVSGDCSSDHRLVWVDMTL